MDKKIDCDEVPVNSSQDEGNKMPALAKDDQYKGLSLSPKKLNEITVKPKVKNGKILLDKNNKDHRYIVEEEY